MVCLQLIPGSRLLLQLEVMLGHGLLPGGPAVGAAGGGGSGWGIRSWFHQGPTAWSTLKVGPAPLLRTAALVMCSVQRQRADTASIPAGSSCCPSHLSRRAPGRASRCLLACRSWTLGWAPSLRALTWASMLWSRCEWQRRQAMPARCGLGAVALWHWAAATASLRRWGFRCSHRLALAQLLSLGCVRCRCRCGSASASTASALVRGSSCSPGGRPHGIASYRCAATLGQCADSAAPAETAQPRAGQPSRPRAPKAADMGAAWAAGCRDLQALALHYSPGSLLQQADALVEVVSMVKGAQTRCRGPTLRQPCQPRLGSLPRRPWPPPRACPARPPVPAPRQPCQTPLAAHPPPLQAWTRCASFWPSQSRRSRQHSSATARGTTRSSSSSSSKQRQRHWTSRSSTGASTTWVRRPPGGRCRRLAIRRGCCRAGLWQEAAGLRGCWLHCLSSA